jgi:tetratricopeptide (TPR) repeat protein
MLRHPTRSPLGRALVSWVTAALLVATLWPLTAGCAETQESASREADKNRPVRVFLDGVTHYEEGDYPAAIAAFSELVETGVRTGELFYNLGNAYLKAGDIGRAILWYERAAVLMPRDADLLFNLGYARGLTRDEVDASGINLGQILLFWNDQLGDRAVRALAIGTNALFWGLLATWIVTRRRGWKTTAWVAATFALVLTLTAVFNYRRAAASNDAIILPEEIVVRSGLAETSTELFRLHAGTRVSVDRRQEDHFRIAFHKDRIGWVPAEAVGMVREVEGVR